MACMVAPVPGWVVLEQSALADGRQRVTLAGPRGRRRVFVVEPWAATPDQLALLAAALDRHDHRYAA